MILLLHGLLNTFGVNLVKLLSDVSAWWHLAGVAVIVLALAFVPDRHQSLTWTFTEFRNTTGWASPVYAILIGLLMAQYTYTGYDASAHVAEETRNAARGRTRRASCRSVWVSILAGWVLLIAVTASIQRLPTPTRNSPTGLPPAQIFIDAAGRTDRPVPAVHLRRRPVLLRDGVGDRELPHVVRLLARRRAAGIAALGQGQPADRAPPPTRSGCASGASLVLASARAEEHHRLR